MKATIIHINEIPKPVTGYEGISHEAVVAIRHKNPCLTLQALSDHFGVSRERIRQILEKHGQQGRHLTPIVGYECLNCGKVVQLKPAAVRAFERKRIGKGQFFCSMECQVAYHTLTLTCSQCGKTFQVSETQLINRFKHHKRKVDGIFCSKECYGAWWGIHFGFGKTRATPITFPQTIEVKLHEARQ